MSIQLRQTIQALQDQYDFLRRVYFVKNIGIFGSLVKNKQKKNSDVDVLVEFSRPVGFFTFIELEKDLSSILKRKVDLATRSSLKSAIKKSILKDTVYV